MTDSKFFTPFKIGLLVVTLSYFLFTLHAMLTLSWWGEWGYFEGSDSFWIYISDISATFGLVFRVVASLLAFGTVVYYFVGRNLSESKMKKILFLVLVAEAVYWMPLVVSGVMGLRYILMGFYGTFAVGWLISMGIPCLVGGILLPFALLKLAFALRPGKPASEGIRWGLLSGAIYILVLWLNNMGMWIYTVLLKGTEYLLSYPENLISFGLTTVGLLALLVFTASFVRKSTGTETLEQLNLRVVGAIIVALGLYFLWNYLSWIIFDTPWSEWYAWFLGHNLDLWLLSIPLVGLPLLFRKKES